MRSAYSCACRIHGFVHRPGRRVSHRWHRPDIGLCVLACKSKLLRSPVSHTRSSTTHGQSSVGRYATSQEPKIGSKSRDFEVTHMSKKVRLFSLSVPTCRIHCYLLLMTHRPLQPWKEVVAVKATVSITGATCAASRLPVYCACLPHIPVHVLDCAAFCRPCMLTKRFLPITHPQYPLSCCQIYFDRAICDCSLVLQPAPEQYRLWRPLSVLFTPFLALALAL